MLAVNAQMKLKTADEFEACLRTCSVVEPRWHLLFVSECDAKQHGTPDWDNRFYVKRHWPGKR